MDALEAFKRSLGCGPEAIDQRGLFNSFEGTHLAFCPLGVGPHRKENSRPLTKPQPFPPAFIVDPPVHSLPSAHFPPPAQPVPDSSSAPEIAKMLHQWSYEQLMVMDK
ncbi:hypothetical protein Q8A73_003816 [Channa argus]|nr:hypothetical protein Q8A73_003816 [Channa argus]